MSYHCHRAHVFASSAMLLAATSASAEMVTLYDGGFTRVSAGAKVAEHCQVEGYRSADNWAEATSHLTLKQDAASSEVSVTLDNARPDTLFTIWLMLAGKTPDGESFGGSPLMKSGATPLIATADLSEAVAILKSPRTEVTNGFITDSDGNGSVTLYLDYPIVGGAYPFQRYDRFDATDPAYTHDTPRAIPVAITGKSSGAPFTLRLASHCGDNLHDGLVAGQHEPWFDWLAD